MYLGIRPRGKNVVLPSAIDLCQKFHLKSMVGKAPNFVQIGGF